MATARAKQDAKGETELQPQQEQESQVDLAANKAEAQKIVEKYSKWSLAAGLIPAPAVDLVALSAVQLKMVSEICKAFDQSFSENKLKSIIMPLLGAALPQALTTGGVSSTVKSIPLFGTLVGMVTMPLLSAGASYAVGHAFISHFENGGTLLTINADSLKDSVKKNYESFKSKNSKEKARETAETAETA